LPGDVQRGYVLLIKEWLAYMAHLQTRYPYLFSLALRTNPFDPFATPGDSVIPGCALKLRIAFFF
jgi:hypothetical protein